MRKSLTILLFSLLVCLSLISDITAQTISKIEGVEDVILDKSEAVLACPGTRRQLGECSEENRKIRISTIVKNTENKDLDFYYLVDGGKIIGRGASVVWDFSEARPGRYLIAVGVGKDGKIQGNLVTKTVSVHECGCHPVCECPIAVTLLSSTKSAKRRDRITFTAQVHGGSQSAPTYLWEVSGGEIIKGQGTSIIVVKPLKSKRHNSIEAKVEAGGFCPECPTMHSSATVKLLKN